MSNKKPIKIIVEDEDNEDNLSSSNVKEVTRTAKLKKSRQSVKRVAVKKQAKPRKTMKKNLKIQKDKVEKDIDNEIGIKSDNKKELEDMNVAIKRMINDRDPKNEALIQNAQIEELKTSKEFEKKSLSIEERLESSNSAVKDFIKNEESQIGEIEETKIEENLGGPKKERSLKLYKRIAYFFIVLTILLIFVVLYFTFATVTITLIPNQERMSNSMIFDIFDKDVNSRSGTNSIKGIVKEIEITKDKIFESKGEQIIGKEVSGKVKIINNYVKNQPLVATTRFLTQDGKLFRLKETVNVAAGSSLEAEVYADEPSPDMALVEAKFTIPGLWAGLQDKIYAESLGAIEYKKKVKKYVTVDDLENSIRNLKHEMLSDAKTQINEEYKDYGQILYKIKEESISSQVEAEAGDEIDTFNASMNAKIIVVAFNEDQAANLAEQKFISSLSDGKEMLEFDRETIVYVLNSYDSSEGSATINASFEGKVSLSDNYDVVKIDKILGLNEEQLNVYLKSLDEIAGFEVYFRPSFIKHVPRLKDKIEIIIKK